MRCEKCNSEMTYSVQGRSCGWKCNNCEWSLVTTYTDPAELDSQLYGVSIAGMDDLKPEMIKFVSELKECNLVEAKQLLEDGLTLDNLKAKEVGLIIKEFKEFEDRIKISPDYPL